LAKEILSFVKKDQNYKDIFLDPVDTNKYKDYLNEVPLGSDVSTITHRYITLSYFILLG
jgi:hypothetical protein